jgi:hypothetical protein
MTRAISILVLCAAAAGCDPAPLPAGAVCEETTDCEDGLACLQLGQVSGGACTVVGTICSITCADDTACGALGADFHCFATCGADMVCAEVAGP